MLTIFLDTESLEKMTKNNNLDILLSLNKDPFIFYRTEYTTSIEGLTKIETKEGKKFNKEQERSLERIYDDLKFYPKNEGQKKFFSLLIKYAIQKNNKEYIHESIFVTENPIFFEKVVNGGIKKYSLRDLFPNLILVNVEKSIDITNTYSQHNGYYIFENEIIKDDKLRFAWYLIKIIDLFPNFALFYKKLEITNIKLKYIDSLSYRFFKLLFCLNLLGYEHYFGNLKPDSIEPYTLNQGIKELRQGDPASLLKLGGLIDPSSQFVLFYHAEYFPSIITGIYDNLALLSANLYNIKMDPIRISFNSKSGKDFLSELEKKNTNLTDLIDKKRPLINLIYEFRERVVHQEGLERRPLPLAPNWTNFFQIDSLVHNYMKQCGDQKSEYKYISKWGVTNYNDVLFVDPYYFSYQYCIFLQQFIDEYFKLLNIFFKV
jgi:hypothetical protein